ncbi:MAG: DUF1579 domain-containing protein [Hyphomicrobiaceae bacterium]
MQPAPVQDEHRWLERLIGEWSYETTCSMGPDQPDVVTKGRETVRALGPYWIVSEGEGEMPDGGSFRMLIQIGFDPALGRFRGTWVGSVMPILWVYDGRLDASSTVLTLAARGPSFAGDGMADYEDIIKLPASGERRFRSRVKMPDGTWNEFMRAEYQRVG